MAISLVLLKLKVCPVGVLRWNVLIDRRLCRSLALTVELYPLSLSPSPPSPPSPSATGRGRGGREGGKLSAGPACSRTQPTPQLSSREEIGRSFLPLHSIGNSHSRANSSSSYHYLIIIWTWKWKFRTLQLFEILLCTL